MYQTIKQWIYPHKCMICQNLLDDKTVGALCDQCYSFVLRHDLCPICGRPYQVGGTYCAYCNNEEKNTKVQVIGLFPYKERFRDAVRRWKYRGVRKYAKGYADLFANDLCVIDKMHIDTLIPVPLSDSRLRKRGFNQALDLAQEIAKQTQIELSDILIRTKDTKPQSQCDQKQRLNNMKGSIAVKSDLKDFKQYKNIALVDDIYTTGATINACIEALKRQNSLENRKIYVLVVCIGV